MVVAQSRRGGLFEIPRAWVCLLEPSRYLNPANGHARAALRNGFHLRVPSALQAERRRANAAHAIYPYLLRGVVVDRPNQVWATDITYIPVRGGFAYLCAVIDWHSRCVLCWELSNTLDAAFCVRVLKRALAQHGVPEIFNTDQGCQFTSAEFTGVLKAHGVRISMDGKGRCLDNVFVERLWRSVKYEEVYLKAYADLVEAERGLRAYFRFYNDHRPHSAHDGQTPAEIYHSTIEPQQAA